MGEKAAPLPHPLGMRDLSRIEDMRAAPSAKNSSPKTMLRSWRTDPAAGVTVGLPPDHPGWGFDLGALDTFTLGHSTLTTKALTKLRRTRR